MRSLRGYKVAGRHSGVLRAETTAERQLAGFRSVGGKTYQTVRKRTIFGLPRIIPDMKAAEKQIKDYGEPKALRMWLEGETPSSVMLPVKEVVRDFVQKEFDFGRFLNERNVRNIAVRHVAHSWLVEAVFENLTGKRYETTLPRNRIVRENEGLDLIFYPKGKIELKYRNKKYDVTKRFNAILAS